MASHSVPRIRYVMLCQDFASFGDFYLICSHFISIPTLYAMMSPPKRDKPSSLSHHHITICLFMSSKNICCHPPFRMLRPCFKRKSEMRVNFVFRAALKSGVDTPSNLLSDSKSSVTKIVDIFLQCI